MSQANISNEKKKERFSWRSTLLNIDAHTKQNGGVRWVCVLLEVNIVIFHIRSGNGVARL